VPAIFRPPNPTARDLLISVMLKGSAEEVV
jgi:hypothetical protein